MDLSVRNSVWDTRRVVDRYGRLNASLEHAWEQGARPQAQHLTLSYGLRTQMIRVSLRKAETNARVCGMQ